MFCQNCGTQVPDGSNNCTNCGVVLGGGQVINQNQQVVQGTYQQPMGQMNYGYQQPMVQTKPIASLNVFAIVAAVLYLITVFLPIVSLEGFFKKSLINGGGAIIVPLITLLAIVGSVIKKRALILTAGISACVMALILLLGFSVVEPYKYYTKEIGYYAHFITSVLLLVTGCINIKVKK